MDRRTIETRLRELAGGADMISIKGIMQYTGMGRQWVNTRLRESEFTPIGSGHGQRYHVHDIAKMLETN